MVGLPVGEWEGVFGAVGGRWGVGFYLFGCWDGAVSERVSFPKCVWIFDGYTSMRGIIENSEW